MKKTAKSKGGPKESEVVDSVKKLSDYFIWRQPYRGDEKKTLEAVTWAMEQTKKKPEDIAVLLLETVNERNQLLRRIRALNVIATHQDFIEDATVESVEWAFGGKLKNKTL